MILVHPSFLTQRKDKPVLEILLAFSFNTYCSLPGNVMFSSRVIWQLRNASLSSSRAQSDPATLVQHAVEAEGPSHQ